jgi:hypothetical protein
VSQFEDSFIPSPLRFAAANPQANCFKTGTSADVPRVPEDALAVNNRTLKWYDALTPQNLFHCWLVDQVAVVSLKIDHTDRIERRARDRVVLRSEHFWDADRRLEAEVLGESLAMAPAKVVNQLQRTPQGCDWMIDRWARLARVADLSKVPNAWDQVQTSIAWDLLGTRAEDRVGEIGEVIDQQGHVVSSTIGLAELARRGIAALLKRKEEVASLDVLDRAMTEADYMTIPTPEIHQIHCRSAELQRRMKWSIDQLRAKPLYPCTKPKVYSYYHEILSTVLQTPAPSDPAEAATTESSPIPAPRIANEETDENGKTWPYLVQARLNAQELKNEAREEARYERRRRLRA